MSEASEEAAVPAQEQQSADVQPEQSTSESSTDWEAEATRLREELTKARKWEQRAKDYSAKVQQYEREKMPEAERAIAEAEKRGRTAATTDFGKRLARTQFDALAGRRNPDFDTSSALEFVDLARFVDEDGEPDAKAIASAVERLVPAPVKGPPSFDGGARKPAAPATDMNSIIRQLGGAGR